MAQSSDRKILRIGIIQNGKIIEERLLRKREAVTIGQSPRNTFVLPTSAVPRSYTLFDLKGGVYHLNFREGMDGRVSVEDAVLDFKAVQARKLAEKRGDHHTLALSEKSRGKVVVGDVTLLFQFVTPPPPPSKLQLPANVRGGWVKNVDWPFFSTVLGSFVFQVFAVAFITTRDYPEPPRGLESLPDRFVEMMIEKKEIPPPEVKDRPEDKKKDDEGEKVAKTPEPEKAKPKPTEKPAVEHTPEQVARAKAEQTRKMQQNVENKTIIKFLGTTGGEGPGSIVDSLKDGAASVSMAAAFDGAAGVVVGAEGTGRDRRGGSGALAGTGTVAGIDKDLQAKGAGPVETGARAEVSVKGSVKATKADEVFGTGVLDNNKISETVKRRMGAVKSCYEKELKRNNKLAGKVTLQFTIEESGRVGSAKVSQDSTGEPNIGECIKSQVLRWRFPPPDGGSVTVSFPFLFAPAN